MQVPKFLMRALHEPKNQIKKTKTKKFIWNANYRKTMRALHQANKPNTPKANMIVAKHLPSKLFALTISYVNNTMELYLFNNYKCS